MLKFALQHDRKRVAAAAVQRLSEFHHRLWPLEDIRKLGPPLGTLFIAVSQPVELRSITELMLTRHERSDAGQTRRDSGTD